MDKKEPIGRSEALDEDPEAVDELFIETPEAEAEKIRGIYIELTVEAVENRGI